jgi:hypothetical protein
MADTAWACDGADHVEGVVDVEDLCARLLFMASSGVPVPDTTAVAPSTMRNRHWLAGGRCS